MAACVKLLRTDGRSPRSLLIGKWITVPTNTTAPGGWFSYNTQQLQCNGSPNAYFRVMDGSSHRWSSRVYVRVGCATL